MTDLRFFQDLPKYPRWLILVGFGLVAVVLAVIWATAASVDIDGVHIKPDPESASRYVGATVLAATGIAVMVFGLRASRTEQREADRLLREWMHHRRDIWPQTPNRHLILSRSSAHGVDPVGRTYLTDQLLPPGITIERIRTDRVLHEAVTVGGDPLHLALVFNLAHTTAGRYAGFAKPLLDDQCDIPKIGTDSVP